MIRELKGLGSILRGSVSGVGEMVARIGARGRVGTMTAVARADRSELIVGDVTATLARIAEPFREIEALFRGLELREFGRYPEWCDDEELLNAAFWFLMATGVDLPSLISPQDARYLLADAGIAETTGSRLRPSRGAAYRLSPFGHPKGIAESRGLYLNGICTFSNREVGRLARHVLRQCTKVLKTLGEANVKSALLNYHEILLGSVGRIAGETRNDNPRAVALLVSARSLYLQGEFDSVLALCSVALNMTYEAKRGADNGMSATATFKDALGNLPTNILDCTWMYKGVASRNLAMVLALAPADTSRQYFFNRHVVIHEGDANVSSYRALQSILVVAQELQYLAWYE